MGDKSPQQDNGSASGAEHIEDITDFDHVISNGKRVLVDFYADWCGPCLLMAPTIDELAVGSDSRVLKVDVEELPQLAARYDVSSIPAFIIFNNGEIMDRFVGAQEKATLAQALQ